MFLIRDTPCKTASLGKFNTQNSKKSAMLTFDHLQKCPIWTQNFFIGKGLITSQSNDMPKGEFDA